MKTETKGRLVSMLIPPNFLLDTRLGNWYDRNTYHKYKEGDILILFNRIVHGFGIRPVTLVNSYENGRYNVTMHKDDDGDHLKWAWSNRISAGIERITESGFKSKWDIENLFKKTNAESVDEALQLYGSTH